jgi:hypothetical protein
MSTGLPLQVSDAFGGELHVLGEQQHCVLA